ncbi:hypothetical protein [Dactylosporangium matsuzakiense]|uniref:REase associating with pPIWI RE domain-containing protein n=2 Tax=Dactylosporangium matsuzakiense TaxID=53360 RepID=A0A9W6KRK3_9ACTN|nr:hypothetical protein [Dactylosporangium matsuzakiense]UWZ50094.1 hypothetical protein Dmats_41775 [Dactylosporangium matsuzakiense]GLL06323.1 hypothetical protein GCM10017581_080720 [Dactylosporangium matsuzakiense]
MPDPQPNPPSWLPKQQIVVAQLASGILEYAQHAAAGGSFRLPYPANLQLALDRLTLLAWQQDAPAPTSVVDLLQLAEQPFDDWKISLADADVDPDESLLAYGRPTVTCEELGSLRGDVEGEIRENALMRAVMDKARAADAPQSYVAFRKLLIRHPAIAALDLDSRLAEPDLALLAGEVRDAYLPAPPQAIADGVVRTCAGCNGLRLPLDDDRSWVCEDETCPAPGTAGVDHPAGEGVWWLRRELRTFITAPGRAELRIADELSRLGVPVRLWPDFDACDVAVFGERPWIADVKAWRNPIRLARRLRERLFTVPAEAEKAFIVIGQEQVRAHPRYLDRLRKACPQVRPGQRVVAVSEAEFVRAVRKRMEAAA